MCEHQQAISTRTAYFEHQLARARLMDDKMTFLEVSGHLQLLPIFSGQEGPDKLEEFCMKLKYYFNDTAEQDHTKVVHFIKEMKLAGVAGAIVQSRRCKTFEEVISTLKTVYGNSIAASSTRIARQNMVGRIRGFHEPIVDFNIEFKILTEEYLCAIDQGKYSAGEQKNLMTSFREECLDTYLGNLNWNALKVHLLSPQGTTIDEVMRKAKRFEMHFHPLGSDILIPIRAYSRPIYVSIPTEGGGFNILNFIRNTTATLSVIKKKCVAAGKIDSTIIRQIYGSRGFVFSTGVVLLNFKLIGSSQGISQQFYVVPDDFPIQSDGLIAFNFINPTKTFVDTSNALFYIHEASYDSSKIFSRYLSQESFD